MGSDLAMYYGSRQPGEEPCPSCGALGTREQGRHFWDCRYKEYPLWKVEIHKTYTRVKQPDFTQWHIDKYGFCHHEKVEYPKRVNELLVQVIYCQQCDQYYKRNAEGALEML